MRLHLVTTAGVTHVICPDAELDIDHVPERPEYAKRLEHINEVLNITPFNAYQNQVFLYEFRYPFSSMIRYRLFLLPPEVGSVIVDEDRTYIAKPSGEVEWSKGEDNPLSRLFCLERGLFFTTPLREIGYGSAANERVLNASIVQLISDNWVE